MKSSAGPANGFSGSKLKWVFFRIFAVFLVCISIFILGEIVLRVMVHFNVLGENHGYIMFINQIHNNYQQTFKTLENLGLFKPSKDPRLGWEAIPGSSTAFIKINSAGFRDDEFALEHHPDTERIVVLGDSEAFGILVKQDETVPAYLEENLNLYSTTKKYEVYNFSIPGYNTTQEFVVLEKKALQYSPSTVVLYYVFNDALISNPLISTGGKLFSRSYVYLAIVYLMKSYTLLNDIDSASPSIVDMYQALHSSEYFETVKHLINKTAQYLHKRNIRFIILIVPEIIGFEDWDKYPYLNIHRKLNGLACENLEIVDLLEKFSTGKLSPREYWASEYDCHKNPVANRIIGEYLAQYLLR